MSWDGQASLRHVTMECQYTLENEASCATKHRLLLERLTTADTVRLPQLLLDCVKPPLQLQDLRLCECTRAKHALPAEPRVLARASILFKPLPRTKPLPLLQEQNASSILLCCFLASFCHFYRTHTPDLPRQSVPSISQTVR